MTSHTFDPAYKAALDGLLIGMPGVTASKAFGHPAYKVNGKIFAFVLQKGVTLKLPRERVEALATAHPEMQPFEVDTGIIWKEWLFIERQNPDEYDQDIALFEESTQFVLG